MNNEFSISYMLTCYREMMVFGIEEFKIKKYAEKTNSILYNFCKNKIENNNQITETENKAFTKILDEIKKELDKKINAMDVFLNNSN